MRKRNGKKRQQNWVPPAMTAEYLREATTAYLERYRPSMFQLEQVLWRKIDKNIHLRGEGARSDYEDMVQQELKHRRDLGVLNDRLLASDWIESLLRKGNSIPQISAKLMQKGIAREIIEERLVSIVEKNSVEQIDCALEAAITYARKRRFGPFCLDAERREEKRNTQIASMMRAGHSYSDIKKIMSCHTIDELEERYAPRL